MSRLILEWGRIAWPRSAWLRLTAIPNYFFSIHLVEQGIGVPEFSFLDMYIVDQESHCIKGCGKWLCAEWLWLGGMIFSDAILHTVCWIMKDLKKSGRNKLLANEAIRTRVFNKSESKFTRDKTKILSPWLHIYEYVREFICLSCNKNPDSWPQLWHE